MSLYIGKDNSNTSALIITKNQLSVESIKSSTPNKLNNFAVDTRRNLLFYSVFSGAPSVVGSYLSNNNVNGNFSYNIYRLNIPSDLIDTGGNSRAFLLFCNDFSYRVELPLPLSSSKANASITAYYYGGTFIDIHSINQINTIQVISTYQRVNGQNIFPRDNSNSIIIGRDKLIVDGINYFNSKYIINGNINTIDPVANISGTQFQFINCYESNLVNLDLFSSSGIKIYTGNKLVLNSEANYLQAFLLTQTPTVIDFSITANYIDSDIYITTLPGSYKLLALTFYPRYSVSPDKFTTSIVSADSSNSALAYSMFPFIDRDGAIKNGVFIVYFKVVNRKVYLVTEYLFDGDPDDSVHDTINMRLSYIVLSE